MRHAKQNGVHVDGARNDESDETISVECHNTRKDAEHCACNDESEQAISVENNNARNDACRRRTQQ